MLIYIIEIIVLLFLIWLLIYIYDKARIYQVEEEVTIFLGALFVVTIMLVILL